MRQPKDLLIEHLKGITDVQKSLGNNILDALEIERHRLIFVTAIRWLNVLELQKNIKHRPVSDYNKLRQKINYLKAKNKKLENELFKKNFEDRKHKELNKSLTAIT